MVSYLRMAEEHIQAPSVERLHSSPRHPSESKADYGIIVSRIPVGARAFNPNFNQAIVGSVYELVRMVVSGLLWLVWCRTY